MRRFVVIGHRATTDPAFSLNNLPGAGRMDELCRCVSASLCLSHGMREDTECWLILCGGEKAPLTIRFSGKTMRNLSPDERNIAGLIKKALALPCGVVFRESTPGVAVRKGGLERVIEEGGCAVLHEDGHDVRSVGDLPGTFLLSDHLDFTAGEAEALEALPAYSLGPCILHADQAITVLHNECDRRKSGWKI
ncbi:tRNA (pseudouridine(54)-N(1))-methyltransferase TrmY [Methanofollis fontis]|uniref:tRNA (pseudouridine(54)-N(1))-methyltransferase n=1 Tax=Methanofollis fontis TaxID=2052832 RepID=A0A483CTT0_9EURY|nr:tRNA (pseudouridine(54)-N(1))-methyltransferase TrmY [Methanofollis fontis]TAJ44813.1 tRNA (pseudouridine(54)-N(1))-methyltransferase TrmY [Methanofollis fontis]